jgi:hypothetical protein
MAARAQSSGGAFTIISRAGDGDVHASAQQAVGHIALDGVPGLGAYLDGICARTARSEVDRGLAVWMGEQTVKMDHVA